MSDVGLGFDYQFNAIENGDNELFRAYKEMFEISIAQAKGGLRAVLTLYVPFADWIFVSKKLLYSQHLCKLIICVSLIRSLALFNGVGE